MTVKRTCQVVAEAAPVLWADTTDAAVWAS